MGSANKIKQLILLAGDTVIFYFSLYLALWLRYLEKPAADRWANHFWPFTVIFIAWLTIFYIARLYNLHFAVNNFKFIQLTLNSLAAAAIISLGFFYLAPGIGIAPKTNLLIHVIIFALLFLAWRRIFNWLLKAYLPKNNIAFIGLNNEVREIARELEQKPHLGYNIAFIVDDRGEAGKTTGNIPIISGVSELAEKVSEKKVTALILSSDPHQSDELRNSLFACLPLKINFIGLPNFYETVTGRIPIEVINQMWFLENLSEGSKVWFGRIKRVYDFVLATIILIVTLPFWPFIALVIKFESRGPVFIKMERSGKNNVPFKMFKFRTMREEGNDRLPTAINDSRITNFGSFLRKTRLDELPQTINILKGDMSFVGPRPERPKLIKDLERAIPFYKERMLVKPGTTGWDQISGEYHSPSFEDSLKKLQYDLFYIKNRSIYLDLSIILKTIATVLSRQGR